MAYMCVLASNHECDGCQECEEPSFNRAYAMRWDNPDHDYETRRDDEMIREEERYDS